MAATATLHQHVRRTKTNMELDMECEDEELSAAQKLLYQQQVQAVKNHALIVKNYQKEKARREELARLRKLEEEKLRQEELRVSQSKVQQPKVVQGNVQTIQNASGIVQNLAKQIVSNKAGTGAPLLLTQIGAQPMFIRAANSTSVLQQQVQPSPLNTSTVFPGQPLNTPVSYTAVSSVPRIIQRAPTKTITIQSAGLQTYPTQASYGVSGMPASSYQAPQQSPSAQTDAGSKSSVKTTVIRVPTGINIQEHLGNNYKLLTSTGNVYHYVYSPATTTTAGGLITQPRLQTVQQVSQPPQPVYKALQTAPPAITAPQPQQPRTLPSSITDILLGKRTSLEQTKPQLSSKSGIFNKRSMTPVDSSQGKKQKLENIETEPVKVKEPRYSVDQFYGTQAGSRDYPDDKYKHGFKCYHCTKLISNNIKYMLHIKNHLDKEKQENLTLNDIINCDHCGRRFNTPFELQCHIEKSHIRNSELKCQICDITLENKAMLRSHLHGKHPPLQMPYSCPICGFRSSVLEDTVDHFKAKHEGIKKILCTSCLRASGDANAYLRHCQKHQTKSGNIRCKKCRLMFISAHDLRTHTNNDHERYPVRPAAKKSSKHAAEATATPLIKVTESAQPMKSDSYTQYKKKKKEVKGDARRGTLESYSLNDWKASFDKSRKHETHRCSECGTEISSLASHFTTFLKCSHCTYRTYCGLSFSNHMIKFHRSNSPAPSLHPVTRLSDSVLQCMRCNYMTESGSAMAGHVMTCVNGPSEVEGFKHHTRPRRQDDQSVSSSNSNSPVPSKPRDTFEKVMYEPDPLLDGVSTDNIHASVSNIIDRLFGADEDSNEIPDAGTVMPLSIPMIGTADTEDSLPDLPSEVSNSSVDTSQGKVTESTSSQDEGAVLENASTKVPVVQDEKRGSDDEGNSVEDDRSPDKPIEGAVAEDDSMEDKSMENDRSTEGASTQDGKATERAEADSLSEEAGDDKATEGATTQDEDKSTEGPQTLEEEDDKMDGNIANIEQEEAMQVEEDASQDGKESVSEESKTDQKDNDDYPENSDESFVTAAESSPDNSEANARDEEKMRDVDEAGGVPESRDEGSSGFEDAGQSVVAADDAEESSGGVAKDGDKSSDVPDDLEGSAISPEDPEASASVPGSEEGAGSAMEDEEDGFVIPDGTMFDIEDDGDSRESMEKAEGDE